MGDPGVTVAIVLAGVFGASLLWIVVSSTRRFLKRQCTELNTFLDFLHFHVFKQRCERCERCEREDYGGEKELGPLRSLQKDEKDVSPKATKEQWEVERKEREERTQSSSGRRDRRNRGSFRGRSPPSPMSTSSDTFPGSPLNDRRDLPLLEEREPYEPDIHRRPPPMPQQMHTPRANPEHAYAPTMPQFHNQTMYRMQGNMVSPMYGQPIQQPYADPMPPIQHPQRPSPAAMHPGPPMTRFPGYIPEGEEEFQQTTPFEAEAPTEPSSRPAQEPQPRSPRRVDLIYIAEEYPPMILEAIEQQTAAQNAETAPSEDDDDEEIQQIPRAYIPRAAPRAALVLPQNFHYQPYEMVAPPRTMRSQGSRQYGNRYAPKH
ncbi:uncharacterized protein EI97DRAFT_280327 [Westerdykella ornata]|uniref:Uncharacterized protein n=1 Tax=Westerdykella ornata TaxID=318751 RepID=A0A6A6JSN0_WESOR|nr:uncharacterized protein EI97DRAFT_280327 [Westerdykella ornata]KAF2277989.1 hypothetical protein EI97DRAFT_280327 [Westerdykella ornata]